MPSDNAPAHEFVVVDDNTPDLLKQCRDIRIAGAVAPSRRPRPDSFQYSSMSRSLPWKMKLINVGALSQPFFNLLNCWCADDEPSKSTHVLLRLVPSLKPIGSVRVVHLTPAEKKIGRLCVLGPFRGFKFGKDLMLAAHEHILAGLKSTGLPSASVKLHSQIYVKAFYAKYVFLMKWDSSSDFGMQMWI